MSPADAAAVNHIAGDLRDMSDADLHRLARKNSCLPGVNAAAVRHEIDKELEFRRAYRHAHLAATPMKQRLFIFSAGSTARVTCKHCGWASQGRGDAQKVFDRSNGHECAGVESYAAMLARHAAEQVAR